MSKHIVIIGNSAGGVSAAEAIRKKDNQVKITIISDEQYLPYRRYLLADLLAGNLKEDDLVFRQKTLYSDLQLDLMLGKKVERVNPDKNWLGLLDKTKIKYDCLIIATGFKAKISKQVKGANKHGVLGFRSFDDIKDIRSLIPITNTVCVWGAGIAGLKAAYALQKKGLEVKLVTADDCLLPGVLDKKGAEFFQKRLNEQDIELLLERDIVEIFGEGDVKAIKLDTGKVIGCGLIIVDRNFVQNTKFIRETAVKIDKGIITDEFLCSGVPNIFAAGDVLQRTQTTGTVYDRPFSWSVAAKQGEIAGINALARVQGKDSEMIAYKPAVDLKEVNFFDLPALSLGVIEKPQEDDYEELTFSDENQGKYRKLVLKDSKVVGFVGVGAIGQSEMFSRLIDKQIDVQEFKNELLSDQFDFELIKELNE